MIEGIPEGYELVRIGKPAKGASYVDGNGGVSVADCDSGIFWPIVRKVELPYAERQAAWVKENDLKAGDKVKVLRAFTDGEGGVAKNAGAGPLPFAKDMQKHVGRTVEVMEICQNNIRTEGFWHWPYFVLEKVLPKTRPMTREEFLAAWKERGWCPLVCGKKLVNISEVYEDKILFTTMVSHHFGDAASYKFASDNSLLMVEE